MKHGLQLALFPPRAWTARFHRPLLEHRRHPSAAQTPLRMIWHTTWLRCSIERFAIMCQVEAHQVEVRQVVEARQVEAHRMDEWVALAHRAEAR